MKLELLKDPQTKTVYTPLGEPFEDSGEMWQRFREVIIDEKQATLGVRQNFLTKVFEQFEKAGEWSGAVYYP